MKTQKNAHAIQKPQQQASRETGFCSVSVMRRGSGRYPCLPYDAIKAAILSSEYDLSIAYVSYAESERLHIQYKHADGPANILSFPLTADSGEIVLHLPTVYAAAAEYDHSPRQHLIFLIIHGMLHLAGYTHGSKMETEERRWMREFGNV